MFKSRFVKTKQCIQFMVNGQGVKGLVLRHKNNVKKEYEKIEFDMN